MDGRRRKTVHAARRPEERPKDASHSSTFTECTAAMLTLPSFAGPTSARSVTRTVRMRFSVGTGLPDCADGGPWPPAPSDAARVRDSRTSSTRARGHTPDKSRRGARTDDSASDGGAGPRGPRPQDDLRLDTASNPWHNRSDWLGRSEVEAVTRVRRSSPDPHPLCPYATQYTRAWPPRGLWTPPPPWTQKAAPTGACKTAENAVSHSAHSRHRLVKTNTQKSPTPY